MAAHPTADNPAAGGATPRSDGVTRRRLLTVGAASTVLGAGVGVLGGMVVGTKITAPDLWSRPDRRGAPPVGGLHLQFGADAATEVVVSWHTAGAVRDPRVLLGTPTGGFGRILQAQKVTYTDGKSNDEVRINHARVSGPRPDTDYVSAAVHDGTSTQLGTFRTAPSGRVAFRFSSFGDQATPALNATIAGAYVQRQLRLARC